MKPLLATGRGSYIGQVIEHFRVSHQRVTWYRFQIHLGNPPPGDSTTTAVDTLSLGFLLYNFRCLSIDGVIFNSCILELLYRLHTPHRTLCQPTNSFDW